MHNNLYPIISAFRTRTIRGNLHIVYSDNLQPAMHRPVTRDEALAIFLDMRQCDISMRRDRDIRLARGERLGHYCDGGPCCNVLGEKL